MRRARALRRQRRAMVEWEDFLESRKPHPKLVEISNLLKPHEHHKEDESECGVIYTVLFNNNKEAHETIKRLRELGVECHNESREWEDYNGKDHMWSICWDKETIYG